MGAGAQDGRALVESPDLLLPDEPCQGLDPGRTRRVLCLIDRLCEQTGLTLIYVTDLHDEMPAAADHVLRLERGSVVRHSLRAAPQ